MWWYKRVFFWNGVDLLPNHKKGGMKDGSSVLICTLPTFLFTFGDESHAHSEHFKQNFDLNFCSKMLGLQTFLSSVGNYQGGVIGWVCIMLSADWLNILASRKKKRTSPSGWRGFDHLQRVGFTGCWGKEEARELLSGNATTTQPASTINKHLKIFKLLSCLFFLNNVDA